MIETINIYLLRHGKTVGKAGLYGHTNIDVAPERQEIIHRQLLDLQLGFQHVETSPLVRCHDLAQRLVAGTEMSLTVREGWKEMSFGDWDGRPFDELTPHWSELEKFWRNPAENTLPNAEPLESFFKRVSKQWQQYSNNVEQDTLIVCHGGTIRMILTEVLNLDWRNAALYSALSIDNQSLTHIQVIRADQTYFKVCSIGHSLKG